MTCLSLSPHWVQCAHQAKNDADNDVVSEFRLPDWDRHHWKTLEQQKLHQEPLRDHQLWQTEILRPPPPQLENNRAGHDLPALLAYLFSKTPTWNWLKFSKLKSWIRPCRHTAWLGNKKTYRNSCSFIGSSLNALNTAAVFCECFGHNKLCKNWRLGWPRTNRRLLLGDNTRPPSLPHQLLSHQASWKFPPEPSGKEKRGKFKRFPVKARQRLAVPPTGHTRVPDKKN